MPLYGYHCAKCDKDFELLIGMSETAVCPTCRSKKLQRLMSRVVPPLKSNAIRKSWRAQAAREGDLSNFSASERAKIKS
jgi:putative FmdB family regulatory protein